MFIQCRIHIAKTRLVVQYREQVTVENPETFPFIIIIFYTYFIFIDFFFIIPLHKGTSSDQ